MTLGQAKGKKRKISGKSKDSSKKRNTLKYTKCSNLKDKTHALSEMESDEETDTSQMNASQMNESRLNMDSANQGATKHSDMPSSGEISEITGDRDETQSTMETLPYRDTIGQGEEFGPGDFMNLIADNWDMMISRLKQSSFWQEQENAMNRFDKEIETLQKENAALRQRLTITEGRLTRTEKKLVEANDKIIDLTARSMRENLVFKNVEEKNGEQEKDIRDKLTSIFKERLKLTGEDLKSVEIERAHRVGKPGKPGEKRSRNIVAKLSSRGKSIVMANIRNLSRNGNDDIRIQEQFPPEVQTRRNKLWPHFLEAKRAQKNAKFSVDKLIVENKVVNPPEDKVRDINLDVTGRSMDMKPKSTAVVTTERSHFQGHIVPIQHTDDVIPAIQSLCQDQRVAGSTHIMYAYRVGNDHYNLSNWEDDGEFGAGRVILNALDDRQCYNHLVVVTRWYGGQHLGPSRFDHIKKMAHQAISSVM